jgi:hypothetical protein
MLDITRSNVSKPLVTTMNYTAHDPHIWIEYDEREREQGDDGVNWDEHISRTARGGGRMELHLMVIQDGRGWKVRRLMFPQRSDRPSFHEGFLRILREESTDMQEEFHQLLASGENPLNWSRSCEQLADRESRPDSNLRIYTVQ